MKRIAVIQIASLLLFASCNNNQNKQTDVDQNSEKYPKGEVTYLNPDELHKNPAYSQLVITKGPMRTIYIGGQNSTDREGQVVGKGDIKAQALQTMNNLKVALAAGDAALSNVIKWNIYIVQGQDAKLAFEALQEDLKTMPHPPIITGVFVSSLAQPDFLVEMDAIAVVPE